ncbi:anaphase-promoting complex APC subunit 1-domain-containing protein [Rhexocercosporidium sp. MPI-PUGE-AT-0058]|nr:anaphase-promoting complex APC subunit 1-domain-containing protein [Rhexocercosporidium sp. MPI-PUGE-AT-0058]
MLRRKPTAITLTTEDIAIYEDARAREAQEQEQAAMEAEMQAQAQYGAARQQHQSQNMRDPNDELRPLPGDRARAQQQIKTREERLGLGLGNGGGRSLKRQILEGASIPCYECMQTMLRCDANQSSAHSDPNTLLSPWNATTIYESKID